MLLCLFVCCLTFFFFKQKTAYEMRISDWSSDVCSSDLIFLRSDGGEDLRIIPGRSAVEMEGVLIVVDRERQRAGLHPNIARREREAFTEAREDDRLADRLRHAGDRKSVVSGKGVSVRLDLGGRRLLKKKKTTKKK